MGFILERFQDKDKSNYRHTSVFGKAQNKDGIGVASTLGFDARLKADQNRKTVRSYRDSRVVNDYGVNLRREIVKEAMGVDNGDGDDVSSGRSRGATGKNDSSTSSATERGKISTSGSTERGDSRIMNTNDRGGSAGGFGDVGGRYGGIGNRFLSPASGGRKGSPPARKNPGIFR